MISLKKYTTQDKQSWNDFNKTSKNGIFMFDRNYMEYHSHRFIDNSLMFYENDKLLALLPLNLSNDVLYSHQGLTFGGFIIDINMKQAKMLECFEIFKKYMKENNISKCIYKTIPYIYHKFSAQEDLYALFVNGAKLYRVDCSSTIYLNNKIKMSELRIRGAKKAQKQGISIHLSENFDTFINLLNKVLQLRHNIQAVHSADELKLLYSNFKNNIKLFVAKYQEEIVAASLIFEHENLVHTQYLASDDQGRKLGALDLLLKTLIEHYSKTKTYFDFGISNENNGFFLNEGLIAQKEGFGARSIAHFFYEIQTGGGDTISKNYNLRKY